MPSGPSARLAELYAAAVQQHQGGRVAAAEGLYRQALAIDPRHVEALHMLGLLAYQTNRPAEAAELIGKAVARSPRLPALHANLALALDELGRLEEAAAAYGRAIALDPRTAGFHANLAATLNAMGRHGEAEAACRRAIALKADHLNAHNNLGSALRALARPAEAEAAYRKALGLNQAFAQGWYNLGLALQDQERTSEAADAFRRAVALAPNLAAAHFNLGRTLALLGELDAAAAAFRRAVALDSRDADAHHALAALLKEQGRVAEAAAVVRRAVALRPDHAGAQNDLGVLLHEEGRLGEAADAYRAAVAAAPGFALAHYNLGLAVQDQGYLDEAVAAFAAAVEAEPDYVAADSARVFCLNYLPGLSAETILVEHRLWAARHADALTPAAPAHPNPRDPERTLRVGYVSSDFWGHPVGRFLERVFAAHDGAAVETFCYANGRVADAVTERLRASVGHWRSIADLSDDEAERVIRADGIDVLVDLSGHTVGGRLQLFAAKPAPVQATWLGYPNTTGMAAMDYRIVDRVTDPPGLADGWAREKLVRLLGGFLCYAPPPEAPPVAPRPPGQGIVFGSFNNPPKISDRTVAVWAALLGRVPDSRLLLKGRPFADERTRKVMQDRFAAHGIGPERLTLRAWIASTGSHLGAYDQVDIGLDPFPYNGTTTTCEALLMGVPVVTLEGDRHAGRVGMSLLSRVGLSDLVAGSEADYAETAAALAGDAERRATLRGSLRGRLLASPLTDGARFAPTLEAAYRGMWRRWCAGGAPEAFDVS